jgi:hypothetical protein
VEDNQQGKRTINAVPQIPTSFADLMLYCPNMWPNVTGGDFYTSIWIGTTKPLAEIQKATMPWCRRNNHAFLNRHLQVENTCIVGWLLYSNGNMDARVIETELSDWAKCPIELRWRVINIGLKGKIPKKDRVQALHIIVDAKHRDPAEHEIRRIYSAKSESFPFDIRMRWVAEYGHYSDPNSNTKCKLLCERQKMFIQGMKTIENREIAFLDLAGTPDNMSLREMLMEFTRDKDITKPLFHSVDQINAIWLTVQNLQCTQMIIQKLTPR